MAQAAFTVSLKLEEVGRLKVMGLQPDDVLVIEVSDRLPTATRDKIAAQITAALPGHTCIVLDGGMTLKAARTASQHHRADTAEPPGYGHAV